MLPRIPLAETIDSLVEELVVLFSGFTRAGSAVMLSLLDHFEHALLLPPPWLFIVALAALGWWATRRPGLPVFVLLGFGLLWNLGLWAPTISTLALVLAATLLSVLLGVPCGIQPGNQADLVLLDLAAQYTIDSNQFYSMGKSTPFDGWHVAGKVVRTIYRGQTVYVEE